MYLKTWHLQSRMLLSVLVFIPCFSFVFFYFVWGGGWVGGDEEIRIRPAFSPSKSSVMHIFHA